MNKDQVKGRVEEAMGSVKQAMGKTTGSAKLQAEGSRDKSNGKTKAAAGDGIEKVKSHGKRG